MRKTQFYRKIEAQLRKDAQLPSSASALVRTKKAEEVSGGYAASGEFTSIILLPPLSISGPPHLSELSTPRARNYGWSDVGSDSNSSIYRIRTSVGDRIHRENTIGGYNSALHSLFGEAPILVSGRVFGRYGCHRVEEKRQAVCDLISGATSGLPLPLSSVNDLVLREASGANQRATTVDMISAIVSRFRVLKDSSVPFSVGEIKLMAVVFKLNITMVHRAPLEDGSMALWRSAPKTKAKGIVIVQTSDTEFARGWIEYRRPESSPKAVTPIIRITGWKPGYPKPVSTIYGARPRTNLPRSLFDPTTPTTPSEQ